MQYTHRCQNREGSGGKCPRTFYELSIGINFLQYKCGLLQYVCPHTFDQLPALLSIRTAIAIQYCIFRNLSDFVHDQLFYQNFTIHIVTSSCCVYNYNFDRIHQAKNDYFLNPIANLSKCPSSKFDGCSNRKFAQELSIKASTACTSV